MSQKQEPTPLRRADLDLDPISQFRIWFDVALKTDIKQPNAMALATATPGGIPSARMVLLRDFDENGFVFFTNYESQKGRELLANPRAALIFYWEPLGRQVRISGCVERIPLADSDEYFQTRPFESRLGAVISKQSSVISNRRILDDEFSKLLAQYTDKKIERPTHWGGFRVAPEIMEFWQHRDHRLHDRFCYTRQTNKTWLIERLSP